MKISLVVALTTALLSCSNTAQNKPAPIKIAEKMSNFKVADFFVYSSYLDAKVNKYFDGLDTDQRAAQLIMPAVSSNNFGMNIQQYINLYNNKKVGGAIFLKGTTNLFADYAKQITTSSKQNNIMPCMISADAESALIHYKFTDIAKMTAAEKLNTNAEITKSANDIIAILKRIGIHINFAPVADNNTNRAIIKNRSFGSNTDSIVNKCNIWMAAQTKQNIASTVKHFPGHGNVTGDTHKGSVYINGNLTELNTFAPLLKNNATGVMVAHITVRNKTKWNSDNLPSTLSRRMVTELLQDSLGYKGVIYTDAMNMGAVSKIPNASFKALAAGCDIALMPLDVNALHAQIKKELVTNGPFKNQLEASIKKIIRLKICLGLLK
jgi:beta-N-acetylhexosaminidase